MWKIVAYTALLRAVVTLIAYDCGHEKMNTTAIAVLNVEKCKIMETNIVHEEEDIQLLELNEIAALHIYQCKINVLQSVYRCGMFSHLSVVPGGLSTFIIEISQEECMKIHRFGTYVLQNNRIVANIKANSSSRHTETIAGAIDSNGNCKGVAYTYGAHSWTDVIVIHAMQITVTDYVGTVRLEDNQVILRNNILCPYLKGRCMDPEYGMSFWEMIPDTSCESLTYTVLYQGNATKAQTLDTTKKENHVIYTVSSGDVVFALDVVKPISVCRYKGFQTEHPRLVIVPKASHDYWFNQRPTIAKNLDLLTYINTKFVYVERHIKTQIQTLYSHLMYKKCEMEREVIKTQLAVAHHHPIEFAFMRMKEQGYTAVSRGEIIYLIKCQPVDVTVRKTDRCFNELPVSYKNESFFMTPTTHLLVQYGNEIPCSTTFTSSYLLHGLWYGFSPQVHRIETPEFLKPSKAVQWKYEDPQDLIKSGIYSFESTEELRKQIMYPSERQAIENVITNKLIGRDIDQQDIDVLHLFSEEHLNKVVGYIQETWTFFTKIGNISASIFGIWVVIRLAKYIISTALNIKFLSSIYGLSWWLLASICDTFTTYLIHKQSRQSQQEGDAELTAVTINPATEEDKVLPTSSSQNPGTVRDTITLKTLKKPTEIYPSLDI